MILLDSSIVIRALRRLQIVAIDQRVAQLISNHRAATTGTIVAEVLLGCPKQREFDNVKFWLSSFEHLTISDGTWVDAARLGIQLRRRGIQVALPDLLIAASAIEHDATLMHADADFDRIAAASDLKVESYVDSI